MKSRLLAIEWDEAEGRLVLAARRGRKLRIEAVERIALPGDADKNAREAALRERVQALLGGRGKADCWLAVGRATLELKHLTLPPAPDEELPELVRFQALREFAAVAEDWPIDFLPIDSDPTQPRHVLAATINGAVFEQLQDTCAGLGLNVAGVVVRPCGMVALAARQLDLAPDQAYLLIDPLDNQLDLAVLQGRSIVFLRCARCEVGGGDEQDLKSITLEVRRTIAAASNRLGNRKLAAVHVCGRSATQQMWAQRLQDELGIPVQTFEPFAGLDVAREVLAEPEEHRSRYAPLIGILLDAVEQRRQSLDFLNPRRPPVQRTNRRQASLIAAAVAACVLLVVGWFWFQLAGLDQQIEQLAAESKEMDTLVKRAQETEKKTAEIDKWAAASVNWLEELQRLSANLPPSRETVVTQLRAGRRPTGGELQFEGLAASAATIDQVEKQLRGPQHAVEQKSGKQNPDDSRYRWSFVSALLVDTQPPVAKKTPAAAPAAPAPTVTASAAGDR